MTHPITFPKTSADTWTNHETGVEIVVYGKGYRAFRPADTSTGSIGLCREVRTLAEARHHAARFIADVARPAIAEAWDEAHRSEMSERRAAAMERMERENAEAMERASDRQVDAWQVRHEDTPRVSAYWMIDAREADHAEALVENTERLAREVSLNGIKNARPTAAARVHSCGNPMTPSVFGPHDPTFQYRSQPIWLCTRCDKWEPRDGWDGPLPEAPNEDAHPYAAERQRSVDGFRGAARKLWRNRAEGHEYPDVSRSLRNTMRTYARVVRTWDDLAVVAAQAARSDAYFATTDAYTCTY
jgi:hypothetical protein